MTLANISMGSEVRFQPCGKPCGILLSESEPIKTRNSPSYTKKDSDICLTCTYAPLGMETWGFVWPVEAKKGHRRDTSQWKPCTVGVGEEGGVRVWRRLFLVSEKSGVCGQWKRKEKTWVKWHEAVLSLSFYMIRVSQSAARTGGRAKHKHIKWHACSEPMYGRNDH